LFDAQELPWKYRTKHSGNNVIPSVFLNLLAATTPESIASSLPSTAIGTGLTSRIVFIWADKKYKKVCYPDESKEDVILKDKLVNDLYLISRIVGFYNFSSKCKRTFQEWYDSYEPLNPDRICKDPAFTGWYERKPLYILKLSMIFAAAESNGLIIEWRHIQKAKRAIEEAELYMSNVFKAVGRSDVAADVNLVVEIVNARKQITEKQLLSLVWRDIDANKLDNVINTASRSGKIRRSFAGPKGERGDVWFFSTS